MLSKIKRIISSLNKPSSSWGNQSNTPARRSVKVLSDDTFLVSYPKSGNTWLRFLIANLLHHQTPISFSNLEKYIPDIYQHSNKELLKLPRPRIMKSHEYFDPRYSKVIYIVRDPRDVAVSEYHYLIKKGIIDESKPIDQWIASFIAGKFHSQYGTWAENVGSWLEGQKHCQDFLLLKYEDCLENPLNSMKLVASFLNVFPDDAQLARAVECSCADRLRALEKQTGWQPEKNTRKDKPFVRAAKSGNWKTDLSEHSVAKIENAWGNLMQKLNYIR